MVKIQKIKVTLRVEKRKTRRIFKAFDFTGFTLLLNEKRKTRTEIVPISSRSEGVAILQKRDKKKSISGKAKLEKRRH
jgi:hypothetical protein